MEEAQQPHHAHVPPRAGDLLSKAMSGDGEAFRKLTEPHRRELHVHCYRMLGCLQDAEDAVQETLLSAWQGLGNFEQRASLRTWLYRIATNRCLNTLRSANRRQAKPWDIPGIEPPEPTRLGEVAWLEPYPDVLLDGVNEPLSPEACYQQSESISLAFVKALQTLPPRQTAVLILRDVLGYQAEEVAQLLETSVESVNSALKRARSGLQRESPPPSTSASEAALVERFVGAYESADMDALAALLTDDVFMSMPPMALEYQGRDIVLQFTGLIFASGRRLELVRTCANGQPAVALYARGADSVRRCTGLIVLTLRANMISAMTRFENGVLPWFGLPLSE